MYAASFPPRPFFRTQYQRPAACRHSVRILSDTCEAHQRANSAILVRGKDEYGHWKSDPLPERDLDPANLKYYNDFWNSYVNPENVSEAERTTAAE